MKYEVTFVRYYEYEVEADDEWQAKQRAYDQFHSDMLSAIADTSYDDYTVEEEV